MELLEEAKSLFFPLRKSVNFNIWLKARSYQKHGIAWLTRPMESIRRDTPGSVALHGMILGDDMGLGKTFQTIAAANALADSNESILVITPASVKTKWARKEIPQATGEEFPDVCVVRDGRPPTKSRWIVINWDLLAAYYQELCAIGFSVLIADEAQYMKTRTSNRSKVICGGRKVKIGRRSSSKVEDIEGLARQARTVFLLTGTPLSNRTMDLYNLLRAIGHPVASNWKLFADRYCGPVGKKVGKKTYHSYTGASHGRELRKTIDTVFLQRKKIHVLKEIPPKNRDWTPVEVDLRLYKQGMKLFQDRRKKKAAENKRLGKPEARDCALTDLIEARTSIALAKAVVSLQLAEDAIDNGRKVIIFSCFTEPLRLMQEYFGDHAVTLDGSKSQKQRDEMVHRFQTDKSCTVFLGNIQAAGTGIDLFAGTYVIMNDLSWVPTDHTQAEDRACRMGQLSVVDVVYVLAADTIDEIMADMLQAKFKAIDDFEIGDGRQLFDQLIERLDAAPSNAHIAALKPIM